MHYARPCEFDCDQTFFTASSVSLLFGSLVLARIFVGRTVKLGYEAGVAIISDILAKSNLLSNEERAYYREGRDLARNRIRVVPSGTYWKPAIAAVVCFAASVIFANMASEFKSDCLRECK